MTEDHEHDHDVTTALPGEELDELRPEDPVDAAKSIATAAEDVPRGTLPLAGGGILLVSALRSVFRGQLRAIPTAAAGIGLVKYGLGRRRASEDGTSSTFEPGTIEGVEGGTEGKETSDEAHASVDESEGSPGSDGQTSQIGEDESGSRIEFTGDEDDETSEPRSKPDSEADADDPRRNTDDDEAVEIDVSESAMADEASEATGPDPEQAQPAQTDATEPEETPEEDASHMKVEPDNGEDIESGTGDETADSENEAVDESDDGDEDEP